LVAVLIVAAVWLASGIYVVQPDEQGVVLRFGAFVGRTTPGLNYHLPWPIESVETPQVTRENQINIGYRSAADRDSNELRDVPEESLMLTGDENIDDVNFTVYGVINNAADYLFNVEKPDDAITAVAESAMREVVGQNQAEPILTADREPIQDQVRDLMQRVLDSYGAGVTVTRVQMQKADPPAQVIDAYRDVQAARTDQDRMRNEAEAYANKVVPEARGQAARIVQQAEGYKQQVIAEAQGEAARFVSVYQEYKKAPDVTRRRIYLDTMRDILSGMNKVILDNKANSGVVPYLPLPAIKEGGKTVAQQAPAPAPQAGVHQ
jgi:membrane protease subunit HflK